MLGPHPRGQQLLSCFPHILQVPRGGQESLLKSLTNRDPVPEDPSESPL